MQLDDSVLLNEMKALKKLRLKPTRFICLLIIMAGCMQITEQNNLDPHLFIQTVDNSCVHTWWHWVDGMVTKEGITKDLESMKKEGVIQATILNLGFPQNTGVLPGKDYKIKKVRFVTDEWYEMFGWALQEAGRLGISIGVHNCDGWSESGGPWITPEMSMKKFVFSKIIPDPEFKGKLKLPKPFCNCNFYRDVAVIAYKNKKFKKNSFQKANPEIILNNEQKIPPSATFEMQLGDSIVFHFNREFTSDKIVIFQGYKGGTSGIRENTVNQYILSYSNDGKMYKKLIQFEESCFNDTAVVEFTKTKACYFKFKLNDGLKLASWRDAKYLLSNVELLADGDQPGFASAIPHISEKSISSKTMDLDRLNDLSDLPEADRIKMNDVIDLTGKMDQDGVIDLNLPDGNWTVLRFGYTTTAVVNAPSTKDGEGLECDKMDTTALNLHFASFPQKLVEHSKGLNSSIFKFLLIDSWECDYQNWTAKMPEEFEKRRGYKLIKWLPVLAGDVVESPDLSEGFLYDFRKTIAEMIEKNYYLHFRDLCHRNNLEMHAEVIYGGGMYPPLDILKTNSYADLPMTEFWTLGKDGVIVYSPLKNNPLNSLASLSNLYNKPVLASEAFTSGSHHSETPADLKLYGDRAYCSGVNQMILHSYVHQPNDKKPGLTLYSFGSHFNRNTPWWKYANGWLDYMARVQYILQKGIIPAEVLYYGGDQLPQDLNNELVNGLPDGIHANPCNLDLLQKAVVQNGEMVFPTGEKFSVLALPNIASVNLSTLKEVERLVKEGATVYGEKPKNMLTLSDKTKNQKSFENLIARLWEGYIDSGNGKNQFGKGTVVWGMPINDLLKELRILPAFATTCPDSLKVLSLHKTIGDKDVFFIVNQQSRDLNFECEFNVGDKIPEIWNPMTGEIKSQLIYTKIDGKLRLPTGLKAAESIFLVFRKENRQPHIKKVELNDKTIFPTHEAGALSFPMPDVEYDGECWSFTIYASGNYRFTLQTGEKKQFNVQAPYTYSVVDLKGKIELSPINGDSIKPIEISSLQSFTDFDSDEIKYFSGKAKYTIEFDAPEEFLDNEGSALLNLGVFKTTGEVKLNGQFLRNIWTSGVSVPVNGILKEHNLLEVIVATTNRNRLIGDLRETGHLNGTWTSSVGLRENSSLEPSGLIGPLQLIYTNRYR